MCAFKFWIKSIQKKIIFLIIYLKYLRKTNKFFESSKI